MLGKLNKKTIGFTNTSLASTILRYKQLFNKSSYNQCRNRDGTVRLDISLENSRLKLCLVYNLSFLPNGNL